MRPYFSSPPARSGSASTYGNEGRQRQDETTPRAILALGVAGPGYRARYPGIEVRRGAPPGAPFSYFAPLCIYLFGGFFIFERSDTTSAEGRPYTAEQLIGAWPSF